MIPAPTNQTNKEITLPDNSKYSYTISAYEVKNALGNVVAVLEEYTFTKIVPLNSNVSYKLYRTKEGNWYELDSADPLPNNELLRELKNAFDKKDQLIGI